MNKIKKKINYFFILFGVTLFLFSCKSQQGRSEKAKITHRSTSFLIEQLNKNRLQRQQQKNIWQKAVQKRGPGETNWTTIQPKKYTEREKNQNSRVQFFARSPCLRTETVAINQRGAHGRRFVSLNRFGTEPLLQVQN